MIINYLIAKRAKLNFLFGQGRGDFMLIRRANYSKNFQISRKDNKNFQRLKVV